MKHDTRSAYFRWLYNIVIPNPGPRSDISWYKLLALLHRTQFTWTNLKDQNRARDGMALRQEFADDCPFDCGYLLSELDGPCSVLEMMVALARRCEEEIMYNPEYGNRTTQWFHIMLVSMHLNGQCDMNFDYDFSNTAIQKMLRRDYAPNGDGGLFRLRKHNGEDMLNAEIWNQMCWYLGTTFV